MSTPGAGSTNHITGISAHNKAGQVVSLSPAAATEKADGALYEAKRLGRDRVAMAIPLQRASA